MAKKAKNVILVKIGSLFRPKSGKWSVLTGRFWPVRKVVVLTSSVCWVPDCIQKKPGELLRARWAAVAYMLCWLRQWCGPGWVPVVWVRVPTVVRVRVLYFPSFKAFSRILSIFPVLRHFPGFWAFSGIWPLFREFPGFDHFFVNFRVFRGFRCWPSGTRCWPSGVQWVQWCQNVTFQSVQKTGY